MKIYQATAIFFGILLGGSLLHGFNTPTEGNRVYGVDEPSFITHAPRRVSFQPSSPPFRQVTSAPQEETGCLACLLRWCCCTTEEEEQESRRRDMASRPIDRREHHERSALLRPLPPQIFSSRVREGLRERSEGSAFRIDPEPALSATHALAPRRTSSAQDPGRLARPTELDIADTISHGSDRGSEKSD